MPKRDQPKTNKGTTNDQRRNKKAFKKSPSIRHTKTLLSPVEKIQLGGGLLTGVQKRWI